MKARCLDPKNQDFKYYGGRGITLCDRWENSFGAFWEDVKGSYQEGLSIDRIDNSRGYEPGNVRWATQKEQTSNCRRNRCYTFQGETKTVMQWCEALGLKYNMVIKRHRAGWKAEEALCG